MDCLPFHNVSSRDQGRCWAPCCVPRSVDHTGHILGVQKLCWKLKDVDSPTGGSCVIARNTQERHISTKKDKPLLQVMSHMEMDGEAILQAVGRFLAKVLRSGHWGKAHHLWTSGTGKRGKPFSSAHLTGGLNPEFRLMVCSVWKCSRR